MPQNLETVALHPDGRLAEFVDKFFVNYADSFSFEGFAEPFLNTEVFFSFGEHFRIGQATFTANSQNAAIIGNRITSVPVSSFGYHYTAGVILKPWGLRSAYGVDGKRSINQLLSIAMAPALKKHTNFRAFKHDTPEVMLEMLVSAMKKMTANRHVKDSFHKIFDIVNSTSMQQADMHDVASQTGLSHKTVIQLFNEHIGIPPLKYIHTKTIIESLKHLKAAENTSLTDLALTLGFYDQSHFIRVFKSCMGMTPTRFIQLHTRVNSVQFQLPGTADICKN